MDVSAAKASAASDADMGKFCRDPEVSFPLCFDGDVFKKASPPADIIPESVCVTLTGLLSLEKLTPEELTGLAILLPGDECSDFTLTGELNGELLTGEFSLTGVPCTGFIIAAPTCRSGSDFTLNGEADIGIGSALNNVTNESD